MTHTTSLHETCRNLFAQYPLAVRSVNRAGTVRSMILILEGAGEPAFFVLVHQNKDGDDFYDLCAWRGGGIAEIGPGGKPPATGEAASILVSAVPIPRDGSFFGWKAGGVITTVITTHSQYKPEYPQPTWTPMPLEGSPASSWAPCIGKRLLGAWFWDNYRNADLVDLAPLVASTPGAVFWALPAAITYGCCAVARDVTSPDGWVLPQGRYLYHGSLRDGESAPPLDVILKGDVTDLSPRFRTGR